MQFAHVDVDDPTIKLPHWFTHAADDERQSDAATLPTREPVAAGTTILVVDDDLANLALAQALLQAEGFEVRVAIDAESAFKVLKTCTPSLILMDIQLPEVDGWELTKRLKSDPATSDIPVIAITAYGKEGDDQKAQRAGFAEFLAKPISTRALPDIVRRHLPARS
jgi:CheY-like chemotaxis protein